MKTIKRNLLLLIFIVCAVVCIYSFRGELGTSTGYAGQYDETTVEAEEDLDPVAAAALEEEESKLECTVWLTKTGECYHLEGCSYLKSMARSMTQKEAIDCGYRPCSRCITAYWLPNYYYDRD